MPLKGCERSGHVATFPLVPRKKNVGDPRIAEMREARLPTEQELPQLRADNGYGLEKIVSLFFCVFLCGTYAWGPAIAVLMAWPVEWSWVTVAGLVLLASGDFVPAVVLLLGWPTVSVWIAHPMAVARGWGWGFGMDKAWPVVGVLAGSWIFGPLASRLLWAGWTDLKGLWIDGCPREYAIATIVISTAW